MDKFDQHIKESVETHEPNPQFVAETMQKTEALGMPKKRWLSWKTLTPMAGGVVVVAVAAIIFMPHFNHTAVDTASTGNSKIEAGVQSQAAVNTPIDPTNTTDTALGGDLNSIQSSLSQSSSDQSSADSSINDNQQQISIPTE